MENIETKKHTALKIIIIILAGALFLITINALTTQDNKEMCDVGYRGFYFKTPCEKLYNFIDGYIRDIDIEAYLDDYINKTLENENAE